MDELAELVTAHWDELYRLAHLLGGRDTSSDDLLQTAMLKAVRSRRAVLRADAPVAYLKRILTNAAIDETDRRRRVGDVLTDSPPDVGIEPTPSSVDRDELWPLIAALPPRQRAVVVLRFYEDLSEREIARVLGCRPGTVKSQGSAAVRKLREALRAHTTAGESDGN